MSTIQTEHGGHIRIDRRNERPYNQHCVDDLVSILVENGYRVQIQLTDDGNAFEIWFTEERA